MMWNRRALITGVAGALVALGTASRLDRRPQVARWVGRLREVNREAPQRLRFRLWASGPGGLHYKGRGRGWMGASSFDLVLLDPVGAPLIRSRSDGARLDLLLHAERRQLMAEDAEAVTRRFTGVGLAGFLDLSQGRVPRGEWEASLDAAGAVVRDVGGSQAHVDPRSGRCTDALLRSPGGLPLTRLRWRGSHGDGLPSELHWRSDLFGVEGALTELTWQPGPHIRPTLETPDGWRRERLEEAALRVAVAVGAGWAGQGG
jgi:hypothetical protein